MRKYPPTPLEPAPGEPPAANTKTTTTVTTVVTPVPATTAAVAGKIAPDDRPTLSAADVAETLGIGLTTALALMTHGKIKAFKIGRLRRTTPRQLREYIERTAVEAA